MNSQLAVLCEQIQTAASQSLPIVIAGGNTKQFYGNAYVQKDLVPLELDMTGLSGIIDYEPTELVMTAWSGTPLQLVKEQLNAAGQMLAFDPPSFGPRATLGGMVAAHWALQQPQQLRELVLINTSMRPFNPAWQRLRPVALLSLLRLAAGRASAQRWEREIIRLTTRHARCDVLDAWCAERLLQPVSASNALRQLLAAARYKAQRQGPELPTLVLSGAGDQLVSPLCSSALALHWRAASQAIIWWPSICGMFRSRTMTDGFHDLTRSRESSASVVMMVS